MATYEPELGRKWLMRAEALRQYALQVNDKVAAKRLRALARDLEARGQSATTVPWSPGEGDNS